MSAYILTSGQSSTGLPLGSGDSLAVSSAAWPARRRSPTAAAKRSPRGGLAYGTVVSSGGVETVSAGPGLAVYATVSSGGFEYIQSGGVASGASILDGAPRTCSPGAPPAPRWSAAAASRKCSG